MEKKVFIVDDEQAIRQSFGKAFRRAGWEVVTAESGEEALSTMEASPVMVLFLDMNLPGMSGIELNRRIRQHWPMAITHAVTGYSSLFELTDCRDAGFEDYFTKPVELVEILEAGSRALAKLDRWRKTAKHSNGVFLPF